MTMDFDANNNYFSTADSVGSSVLDTPIVNSNPGRFKNRRMYSCTTHYDPATGCTIGAEATGLVSYYQCLKDMDGKMQLTNVGAGIGGVVENTMKLKLMKYKEAMNRPDGEAWAKEMETKHDQMVRNDAWEPVKKSSLPRGTKVIDSTWACKKKSTEMLHGRLNAHNSSKLKACTTTDQVPTNQSVTPVPSRLC